MIIKSTDSGAGRGMRCFGACFGGNEPAATDAGREGDAQQSALLSTAVVSIAPAQQQPSPDDEEPALAGLGSKVRGAAPYA